MTRRSDAERGTDAPRSAATVNSLGSAGDTGDGAGASRPAETPTRGSITVRRAMTADLPVVVELRLALLRENGDHPIYGRLRTDARQRAYDIFGAQLRSSHEAIFLAETAGSVVGILRCVETLNSPLLHPDRYCYVSSVYVRPDSRRGGILKALLQRAEVWCGERGLTEMRLHNVPGGSASAAWNSSGFEVVEEVRRRELRGR